MVQRSLLITGIALAALAALAVGATARPAAAIPWLEYIPVRWTIVVAAVVAVYAGAHGQWRRGFALRAGAVPALLTMGVLLVALAALSEMPAWRLGLALLVALPIALLAEFYSGAATATGTVARTLRALGVYVAALALFTGIYGMRLHPGATVAAVGLIGALLAWLLWQSAQRYEEASGRVLAAATVAGLVMAQAAWPLLYWRQPAPAGGLALLVVFYASSGMLQSYVSGRAGRWRSLEYAATGLVGLIIVLGAIVLAR